MRYEEDGEYAIRKLDGMEWGYKKRPLRLQWSKMKEADRQRHVRPTTTLFVVNFDAARTRTRDLERLFEKYGPLRRVEVSPPAAVKRLWLDATTVECNGP